MTRLTPSNPVGLGLIKFAPVDRPFRGRNGRAKYAVIDTRGAGTSLPLRELIVEHAKARLAALPACDVIAGVSKSGTVWAAWLSWVCTKPFANVLPDGPRHSGLEREVEGDVSGSRVVLVDNWIRSGASINGAISAVQRAGGAVVGVLVIVERRTVAFEVPVIVLWQYKDLLASALDTGLISPELHAKCLEDES